MASPQPTPPQGLDTPLTPSPLSRAHSDASFGLIARAIGPAPARQTVPTGSSPIASPSFPLSDAGPAAAMSPSRRNFLPQTQQQAQGIRSRPMARLEFGANGQLVAYLSLPATLPPLSSPEPEPASPARGESMDLGSVLPSPAASLDASGIEALPVSGAAPVLFTAVSDLHLERRGGTLPLPLTTLFTPEVLAAADVLTLLGDIGECPRVP